MEAHDRSKNIGKYEIDEPMRTHDLIQSDKMRFEGAAGAITKLGFYAAFFFRVSHYCNTIGALFLARCLQGLSHVITGAEISHRAIIGPGLALLHPIGVVIGPGIKIGKGATICQGVTISTNFAYIEAGIEVETVIGDHLWAGPNCAILGPLTMGDRVFVGPNAVVYKDVRSYMKALGNPARLMPMDAFGIPHL